MSRRLRTLLVALIAALGIAAASPGMALCARPMCMVQPHCGSRSLPLAPRPCCVKGAPQVPAVTPAVHAPANPLIAAAVAVASPSPLSLTSTPWQPRTATHGHRSRPLPLLLSTLLI
ncbi:MAG: hypothetical protein KGN76_11480 [Acidobacteriota bacterium]|nr:hypothetical protein [Acidobacteriota bacterium]